MNNLNYEELFHNEWISLRKVKHATGEYVYSHETRCDGFIVAILPFRFNNGYEFLIREEKTPCWLHWDGTKDHWDVTLTGGAEVGGLLFDDDAVREIREETGYIVDVSELHSLGVCHGSKSSDTVYALFTVNLTGKNPEPVEASGTEATESYRWGTKRDILKCTDPLASVIYLRLMDKLE